MNEQRRRHYLAALGIQHWRLRSAAAPIATMSEPDTESNIDSAPFDLLSEEPETVVEVDPRSSGIAAMDWSELQQTVGACTACPLHAGRTQAVFGVGSRQAEWLIVGEAPGAEEDRQGEPFVGRSGKLLERMLQALELNREQVFIANIVKCRPPNNRDPQAEEAHACRAFLQRQIALLKPRIVLAVGRVAAQQLLNTTVTVGRLRGRTHRLPETNTPLVVTYHPAYILRSPGEKRKVWDDLQRAKHTLLEETTKIRLNS